MVTESLSIEEVLISFQESLLAPKNSSCDDNLEEFSKLISLLVRREFLLTFSAFSHDKLRLVSQQIAAFMPTFSQKQNCVHSFHYFANLRQHDNLLSASFVCHEAAFKFAFVYPKNVQIIVGKFPSQVNNKIKHHVWVSLYEAENFSRFKS